MSSSNTDTCPAGCPTCPIGTPDEGLGAWTAAHDEASVDTLSGSALLGRAASAFGLPVLGALAGVVTFDGSETARFGGMVGGLAIGMIASLILAKIFTRRRARKDQMSTPVCIHYSGTQAGSDEESA